MVTPRDPLLEAIADYLRRYRLITAEALAARHLDGCRDEPQARELLECLESQGWLERASLLPGEAEPTCFYASARGATHLGDPSPADCHRTLEERLAYWAVAQFCAGEKPFRELLTSDEFRARFLQLWKAGEPHRYYLEPIGDMARLAFIKVDLGGASHWDRVVDSCCRFIKRRLTLSANSDDCDHARAHLFRQLIEHGRFQVSVLVASPEKANAIDARLDVDAVQYGERPPIVPYVVPGLLPLLVRSPLTDRPVRERRSRTRCTFAA